MNGSNIDPKNSIHCSPLRGTYLLIAGLLGGFGLFIVLAVGIFLGAQASNATPPPDPALTAHFGRDVPFAKVRATKQCGSRRSYGAG